MFHDLTLRGGDGAIVWGYHTAAALRSWTLSKGAGGTWALSAVIVRADRYKLQQSPLQFTAPRKGGYFCFPVVAVAQSDARTLSATLGPPEQ